MVTYNCDICASKLGMSQTGVIASTFIYTEKESQIAKGFRHPKKGQERIFKFEKLFCPTCTDKIKENMEVIARAAHFDDNADHNKLEEKK